MKLENMALFWVTNTSPMIWYRSYRAAGRCHGNDGQEGGHAGDRHAPFGYPGERKGRNRDSDRGSGTTDHDVRGRNEDDLHQTETKGKNRVDEE